VWDQEKVINGWISVPVKKITLIKGEGLAMYGLVWTAGS